MSLSIRLRRDFTVTDADRLLATARRVYCELNPDVSAEEAGAMVTCAADALFVILERAGLLGDATEQATCRSRRRGLAVEGWRAEAVINEPEPLSPEPRGNCLRGDVFALPDRHQD